MHLLSPRVGATGGAHSPAPCLAASRSHAGWMQGPQWRVGVGDREGVRGRGRQVVPLSRCCLKSPQRSVWPWFLSWLLLHIPLPWPREPSAYNLDSWRVALAPKHGRA